MSGTGRRRRRPPGTSISLAEGRRLLASSQSEESLLQFVRDTALTNQWLCYHTRRSDRSDKGFYDVVAIHAPMRRIVLAELKTTRGRFTDEQKRWGAAAALIAGCWAQAMVYRDPAAPLATAVYPPRPSGMYPPPQVETWPLAYFQWRPTKEDKDEILRVFKWQR